MLQKVQAFNTEKNNLPLKAAGAFVGAALGAVLVTVALSLIEDNEEAFHVFTDENAVSEETE